VDEDPKTNDADRDVFRQDTDGLVWSNGSLTIGLSKSLKAETYQGTSQHDTISLIDESYSVNGAFGDRKLRDVDFLKGDFTVTQKGVWSSSTAKSSGSLVFAQFDPEFRNAIEESLPGSVRLDQPLSATGGLQNAFAYTQMLKDFVESDGFGGALRAESIITLLVGDIYKRVSQSRQNESGHLLSEQALSRIDEFIDAHVDAGIGVKALADLANISQFHFSRAFKESTGLSPHQYVLRHRLEKVRSLLRDMTKSLAEVAVESGFSSQSHMSTAFQKQFGISPGKYRLELNR